MFYFSGTGNARNVAAWMVASWRRHGREAELVDLAPIDARTVRIGDDDVVGLASPTHGFNYPPITLRFLWRLPRAPRRNRAFVMNTRAGVRLGRLYVPGLSGVALLLAAAVLLVKGYRVVGMRPVDLPSNWISLHPGLREDHVRELYRRWVPRVEAFAERLLAGRRDLAGLRDLPQDLLAAPFSIGYFVAGRFFFAKSFVASRACDGCGACRTLCPVGALRMVDGRPFWTRRCESCMRCMNACPRRAIETAHGFAVGVPAAASLVVTRLLLPAVLPLLPAWASAGVLARLLRMAVDSALVLVVLFAAYRLLHRALRARAVERVVVATSLTHFAFWRRYRAPKRWAASDADER